MMKRKISIFMLIVTLVTGLPVVTANAEESGTQSTAMRFSVTRENFEEIENSYDVPKEVADYVEDVLSKHKDAKISIDIPNTEISTYSSTGSWSGTRTYKGYTLKDWNVTVNNAFSMTSVKTGTSSMKFADSLLLYGAGVLLDKVVPFGSAGVTLIDIVNTNSDTVRASSGDKVQVAPMYTSYTKFTYVKQGSDFVLGARTHKATLKQITWYLYSDNNNKQYTGKVTYNKTVSTSSYANPDAKAISSTGTGGYIEDYIYVSINGKKFVLD